MPSTKNEPATSCVILLMGVSGAGKTTIGEHLAAHTGWMFVDGDDFHPPANVEKMTAGTPLVDADRRPWLKALRSFIDERLADGTPAIIACSALKAKYRALLGTDREGVHLVFLRGTLDQIKARLATRTGHFFDGELLATQFDALEAPDSSEAFVVDIDQSPEEIVTAIQRMLSLQRTASSS